MHTLHSCYLTLKSFNANPITSSRGFYSLFWQFHIFGWIIINTFLFMGTNDNTMLTCGLCCCFTFLFWGYFFIWFFGLWMAATRWLQHRFYKSCVSSIWNDREFPTTSSLTPARFSVLQCTSNVSALFLCPIVSILLETNSSLLMLTFICLCFSHFTALPRSGF